MKHVRTLPDMPPRRDDTHKGTYGRVLIVAGSAGMAGAAILAARAALRTGSGLVSAALPRSLSAPVTASVPEATQLLLPDPAATDYRSRLMQILGDHLRQFQAVAVGPGLGRSDYARFLVETVLNAFHRPQVVDADALNIIALHAGVAPRRDVDRVWTPHPGEFQRLTGEKPEGASARVGAAERFVTSRGGVVVLKGHRTVVADKRRYYVNDSGNPGMATGGSGDVLTGVIVSLAGQGFPVFEAACLGVHLHGRAGDLAAERLGQPSVIAGDLIDFLPAAILEHCGERGSPQP